MMENMNEVVEAKIAKKLEKGLVNAQAAATRLIEEGKMAVDFIYDVGASRKGVESKLVFRPDEKQRRVTADFLLPETVDGQEVWKTKNFTVNRHAVSQVATKLNIPGDYLTKLLDGENWQEMLAYHILNMSNNWTDHNKVLVRTIGNEVRAVCSDQFLRLDSRRIFDAHVEEVFKNGGQLSDGYMDDLRVMIESIYPKPISIITPLNGTILVAFGTRWRTSDYGAGAHVLQSFILQGVCLNGNTTESVLREKHLGAKLPDNLALSAETYESDTKTRMLTIRDLTRNLYSSEVIKDKCLQIEAMAGTKVEAGEMLSSLFGLGKLMKGETEDIGKILMRNSPEDGLFGESTLWKLSQGITSYANTETVSAVRRMDLQDIAGELFKKIKN